MTEKYSEKDKVYLANVAKIGDSEENIIYIENALSKEEHEIILDYAKNVDYWHDEPWDAKSVRSERMPQKISDILRKLFTFTHEKAKSIYDVEIDYFKNADLNILKFVKGFYLNPHLDTNSNESNHIASVYYINDDYTGGEINFPDYKLKIKPKANSLIIFPGNENYLHEVTRIQRGDRYSSSLWFQFTGSTFNKKKQWYD
jgi:Rps23 Pro-64 3,4-dihydroxylase Tpa1-like proline 4-hydroxylase